MTDTGETKVYPPERSPKVTCPGCDGTGERPQPPAGQRWAMPECRRCQGAGQLDRPHYAYCKRAACVGCLPTVAEIDRWPKLLDVFAEMLARGIPQSRATKTHEGAVAAIRENAAEYHAVAFFARRYNLVIEALRPMLDGCAHDFDPECGRCQTMTPVRLVIEQADARRAGKGCR